MKKILLLVLISLCFLSCSKDKNLTSYAKSEEKTPAPVKEELEVPELENEIIGEDFEKGKNIHAFEMVSIKSGEKVKFGDFKGKRILVDFWASWCEPCIAMFPELNKLKNEYEDGRKTLKILSVSVDPMPGKIKNIVAEKNAQFDVLQAPESLAESGVIMPYMVLTDESGKVILTISGKHTYEELEKFVNSGK